MCVKFCKGSLFDGTRSIRCSVLYQDVNVRKVMNKALRQVELAGTAGQVNRIAHGLGTRPARYRSNRLQSFQPATDQVDAGSGPGQGESHGRAYPSSTSGDDSNSALERAHLRPRVMLTMRYPIRVH